MIETRRFFCHESVRFYLHDSICNFHTFILACISQTNSAQTAPNIASNFTHKHCWEIHCLQSGKNKVCEMDQSLFFFFCMGKNILLSEFSVAVFDLWDIYTSNTSIFQQPLFLVGVGLLSTCQTLKENKADLFGSSFLSLDACSAKQPI